MIRPQRQLFSDERTEFRNELEAYYSAPLPDTSKWSEELDAECDNHPEWSLFRQKIAGYRLISEECEAHIFRHCPFYFELGTGRPRTDLGYGGIGCWMKKRPAGARLLEEGTNWLAPCGENGLTIGWPVTDDNHHSVDYETVLTVGLHGLIRRAEEQLDSARSEDEREFLCAAIEGNRALIRIAERFAETAARLAVGEQDGRVRARLEVIAATARRIPSEPATSFYEALCAMNFIFYMIPAVESSGISMIGHLDRILIPYYKRDLDAGLLTASEARDLLSFFMAISDTRFGMMDADPNHVGTNGTIMLGGCDRAGILVYNELTRMILDIHRDAKLVDPKMNVRVSSKHPKEFFDDLAEFALAGDNSLSVFNDDVIIAANVRAGKAIEDCRQYVGGGCQENVLESCEINSRATIYLNLAQVFLMGFFPEQFDYFISRDGIDIESCDACSSYEKFYDAFLRNLRAVVEAHVRQRNLTEGRSREYNPCPLHSSMLNDCIERRRDMMEGGCRYSQGSISLTGIGTLIDSLYAVKTAVYDKKMVSLKHLRRMLETDFENEEVFRNMLANKIPKFGQTDQCIRDFSSEVFSGCAGAASGMSNTRGGRYEASLFSFRSFIPFGKQTGCTPDGRKAGEHLSAGMSPSLLALGRKAGVSEILAALEPIDMTLYPVVAVLDIKLPSTRGGLSVNVVSALIQRFVAAGGSVLQMNLVDQSMLEDARRHPELHPDLVVRVSGYSSYFTVLAESIQDEIVARTAFKV